MSTDCLFSMYRKLLGLSRLHVVSRAAVGKAPGAAWRVPAQGRVALSRLGALCRRRKGRGLQRGSSAGWDWAPSPLKTPAS